MTARMIDASSQRPGSAVARPRRLRRRRGRRGGVITADGSSTVGPFVTKAAEDFKAGAGRRRDRRHLRHRRRVRALLRRRDRPLERVATDRRGRAGALRGGGRRVHRVPGRHRRADERREHRERLGDVPDRRAAEGDLGAGLEGHELEPGRPVVPRRPAQLYGAGHRLRHVRLLHRRRSTARRARAAPTTRRARTTTSSSRASRATGAALGYFGFSYFEQNQDTLEGPRGRRRQRLRRPERRGGAGRHVRAALAPALRLREAELVRRQRGRPQLRRVHARQQRVDRRGGPVRAR